MFIKLEAPKRIFFFFFLKAEESVHKTVCRYLKLYNIENGSQKNPDTDYEK